MNNETVSEGESRGNNPGLSFGFVPKATDEAREAGLPFPTESLDLSVLEAKVENNVVDIAEGKKKVGRPKRAQTSKVQTTEEWEKSLAFNTQGEFKDSVFNLYTILTNHESWAGKIRRNLRKHCVVFAADAPICSGTARSIDDTDAGYICRWLTDHYRMDVNPSSPKLTAAIEMVATDNSYDPVEQYLSALKWDGVERLDGLLTEYFKAEPTSPINALWLKAVGSKFLVSAVARTMNPGCKADHVLVLSGTTGYMKSTGVMVLALGKYHDTLQEFESKDSMMKLNEVWLVELEEMQAYRKSDVDACKSFVSRCVDKYRSPYGRNVAEHPRRCVFMGTTEHFDFLNDDTNRRFWPVHITQKTDLEKLAADRDQLWAEAVHRYRDGEPWHITDDLLCQESLNMQNAHAKTDAWMDVIDNYLSTPAGRRYETSVAAILEHGLQIEPGRWTQSDQNRVARVLKKLGYLKEGRGTADQDGRRAKLYRKASVS